MIKLIILGIKFKFFREISFASNDITKPKRKINLVNVFQNKLKTKYLILLKIIIKIIRLMKTNINLI